MWHRRLAGEFLGFEDRQKAVQAEAMPTLRKDLWLYFLLVCAMGLGFGLWQNHQQRLAVRTWQTQCINEDFHQRGVVRRFLVLQSRHAGASISEVERLINEGKPFEPRLRWDRTAIARWRDPSSDIEFVLYFEQGRWTEMRVAQLPSPRSEPAPSLAYVGFHAVREPVARQGVLVWAGLLAIGVAWHGRRLVIIECSLGAALVCTLAWLLSPEYPVTNGGVFSNRMLAVGGLMMLLSAAVLILAGRKQPPRHGQHCLACDYSLKGNTSGICPECGTPIAADAPSS